MAALMGTVIGIGLFAAYVWLLVQPGEDCPANQWSCM